MIFRFPDAAVLCRVLSTTIPKDLAKSPAEVVYDGQAILIKTSTRLSKVTSDALAAAGVTKTTNKEIGGQPVKTWYETVPLIPARVPQETPAVFLAPASELTHVLGDNDSEIVWLDDADNTRAVVYLTKPPYHILLRAADRENGLQAFINHRPGVWVEVGYTHPFLDKLKFDADKITLIPRHEEEIYLSKLPTSGGVRTFQLQPCPALKQRDELLEKIKIQLKLAEGGIPEASLWVVSHEDFYELISSADEKNIESLQVAMTEKFVVLRWPEKMSYKPLLNPAGSIGYAKHRSVADLYLPTDYRVFPPLRKNVLESLVAPDQRRCVWLSADGVNGDFVPESLPIAAFKPIKDYYEYSAPETTAQGWWDARKETFPFKSFYSESNPPKEKEKPAEPEEAPKPRPKPAFVAPARPATELPKVVVAPKKVVPNDWRIRREELEKQFLALTEPADHPDRREIWVGLAEANTGEERLLEASICRLQAIWMSNAEDTVTQLAAWAKAELGEEPENITAARFDKLLDAPTAKSGEHHRVLAWFLWFVMRPNPPKWIHSRLAAVSRYIEDRSPQMSLKLSWITARAISHLAGDDILGLARSRDRLLQQILDNGPLPEKELPMFLRVSGAGVVSISLPKIHQLQAAIEKWSSGYPVNKPYVELILAFAYAKLGDHDRCLRLQTSAQETQSTPANTPMRTTVRDILLDSYRYRIDQACRRMSGGLLPPEIVSRVEALRNQKGSKDSAGHDQVADAICTVNTMIGRSQILEPQMFVDAYDQWQEASDPLVGKIAAIVNSTDPKAIAGPAMALIKATPDAHPRLLRHFLPVAPRVSEEFALALAEMVPPTLAAIANADKVKVSFRGQLLNSAMIAAGHYGLEKTASAVVDCFIQHVRAETGMSKAHLVASATGQTLGVLRKLGLGDSVEKLVTALADSIGVDKLNAKTSYAATTLQAMISIAGGWLAIRRPEKALPTINTAREILLGSRGVRPDPHGYARPVMAYLSVSLGLDDGIDRCIEFFEKMPTGAIANALASSEHYTQYYLEIVETVAVAISSDTSGLGAFGKAWLDDDELSIRKRIHSDVAKARLAAGL
jgi:hypothetical protein